MIISEIKQYTPREMQSMADIFYMSDIYRKSELLDDGAGDDVLPTACAMKLACIL